MTACFNCGYEPDTPNHEIGCRVGNPRPAGVLAIDPGDVHIGLACFHDTWDEDEGLGWRCIEAYEYTREQLYHQLLRGLIGDNWDAVVVERFNLYPEVAMKLTGQEMLTSEAIGAIELACLRVGVPMFKQPAAWQQPTLGLLRQFGLKSTAKLNKTGPHALSAELHGWAYLIRGGLVRGVPIQTGSLFHE